MMRELDNGPLAKMAPHMYIVYTMIHKIIVHNHETVVTRSSELHTLHYPHKISSTCYIRRRHGVFMKVFDGLHRLSDV